MNKLTEVNPGTASLSLDSAGLEERSDDELVALYASGSQTAFETLYQRHRGPVYRFFARQLDNDAAHDAFQETWSKFIASVSRYQPQGKFRHYLFTIAYNTLHDWHRKQMRHPHTQSLDEETAYENSQHNPLAQGPGLEKQVEQHELIKHLIEEIKQLPINQRDVWLMRQESGFGISEIAALTGSNVEAVKSRLRYANSKLKARMKKYVRA